MNMVGHDYVVAQVVAESVEVVQGIGHDACHVGPSQDTLAKTPIEVSHEFAREGLVKFVLAGHRDYAQTSCPGANLYAHLSSGDLKRRIDTLLTGGGVNLERFCGPSAATRVAAIEAGN